MQAPHLDKLWVLVKVRSYVTCETEGAQPLADDG